MNLSLTQMPEVDDENLVLRRAQSSSYQVTLSTSGLTATHNVTADSDERLKDNIVVIDGALEKVSQLRGVTYDRTDTEEPFRQTGVIAQEVQKVILVQVNQKIDKITRNIVLNYF